MAASFRAVREWMKAPVGCGISRLYICSVPVRLATLAGEFAHDHDFWSYVSSGILFLLERGSSGPILPFVQGTRQIKP